jgi:hypothetical protein
LLFQLLRVSAEKPQSLKSRDSALLLAEQPSLILAMKKAAANKKGGHKARPYALRRIPGEANPNQAETMPRTLPEGSRSSGRTACWLCKDQPALWGRNWPF